MPTARYGLQANVIDGKIYLMGGVEEKGYDQGVQLLNVTEVYDPSSDTWATKSPMPNLEGYVSAVVNNKIYVIGPARANGIAAAAAATTGVMAPTRIYVYDGSYLQVYNPQNDSWTLGTNPPINRQYLGIAVVNDMLYFIGGFTYAFPGFYYPYATNEQYTPFGYGTPEPSYTIPPPTATPIPTLSPSSLPIIPDYTRLLIVGVVVAVGVAALGLLVYFKKRK